MADSTTQIQSYVWYEGQCFFVSTIERESSSPYGPGRYMETIAWEYDEQTRKRGKMVAMDGSGPALAQHFGMCQQLYRTGTFAEAAKEEDDASR